MAWGSNLLINQSAETNDTTGWVITPIGTVVATENVTASTRYIPFPDSRDKWISNEHTLSLFGPSGDYCFRFDPTAQMEQILYASDVGSQPVNFQLIGKYKLEQPQYLWDVNVLGMITLTIYYTDGTSDYFIIPCVKGVTHIDRNLSNWWIIVYNICAVTPNKTLSYVKVTAKTINCSQIVNIDYIELRKEV